jgi:hypothetical protein
VRVAHVSDADQDGMPMRASDVPAGGPVPPLHDRRVAHRASITPAVDGQEDPPESTAFANCEDAELPASLCFTRRASTR